MLFVMYVAAFVA